MKIWITTLRCVIALLCSAVATWSSAQVSGSVSAVSDYRYRGISLSGGDPALQATLNYDHASGWYAGGFGSTVRTMVVNATQQWMTYAGYSHRLDSGWNLDVGTSKLFFPQVNALTFSEIYAGLSFDNVSGKLYYSPNYLGENARSVYAELNGGYPLGESLFLTGHIGFLHSFEFRDGSPATTRSDARIGLSLSMQRWSYQLAWVIVKNAAANSPRASDTVVLNAIYAF